MARHAETADSLPVAFLVLLESLGPIERAVFLLHDVLDYGYDLITAVVGKSEDNCRQIAAPCPPASRGKEAALRDFASEARSTVALLL